MDRGRAGTGNERSSDGTCYPVADQRETRKNWKCVPHNSAEPLPRLICGIPHWTVKKFLASLKHVSTTQRKCRIELSKCDKNPLRTSALAQAVDWWHEEGLHQLHPVGNRCVGRADVCPVARRRSQSRGAMRVVE